IEYDSARFKLPGQIVREIDRERVVAGQAVERYRFKLARSVLSDLAVQIESDVPVAGIDVDREIVVLVGELVAVDRQVELPGECVSIPIWRQIEHLRIPVGNDERLECHGPIGLNERARQRGEVVGL